MTAYTSCSVLPAEVWSAWEVRELWPRRPFSALLRTDLTWLLGESFRALKRTTPSSKKLEDPYCKYTPRIGLHGTFQPVTPAVGADQKANERQSDSASKGLAAAAADDESEESSDPGDAASTVASSSGEGDGEGSRSESPSASLEVPRKSIQRRVRSLARSTGARRRHSAPARGRDSSARRDHTGGEEVGSTFSLNLHMRLLLHLYADLHNPVHNISVFTEAFPHGDRGGNLVSLQSIAYTTSLCLRRPPRSMHAF